MLAYIFKTLVLLEKYEYSVFTTIPACAYNILTLNKYLCGHGCIKHVYVHECTYFCIYLFLKIGLNFLGKISLPHVLRQRRQDCDRYLQPSPQRASYETVNFYTIH
jgi:hypothetical protein